jgi:LysM repeat protein
MRTSLFKKTRSAVVRAEQSALRTITPTPRLLSAMVLGATLACALPMDASAANNPAPHVRADAPNLYIVKRGDTLWDISKRFLNDAWRWPQVWAANPQVKNPHLIYPGDRLLLCKIEGRTVVGRDEGDGCAGIALRMGSKGSKGSTDGRLSPRIRVEALDVAVPAIPASAIQGWLTQSQVVSYDTLQQAPYVLAAQGRRVVTGAGDTIYIRGEGLQVGDSYGIFREGERYTDPETHETLGYEARMVARGTVTAMTRDVTSIELTESYGQEVREGDRILPEIAKDLPPIFYPTNSDNVAPGRLIRVMDSVGIGAIRSVIAINRGTRDGAQAGQVVAIHRRGALVRDPKIKDMVRLPSERSGLAMIFRSFDRLSYAYVLEADEPLKLGDEIRPPVSTN